MVGTRDYLLVGREHKSGEALASLEALQKSVRLAFSPHVYESTQESS